MVLSTEQGLGLVSRRNFSDKKAYLPHFAWVHRYEELQRDTRETGKAMEENALMSTDLELLSSTRYLLARS